MRTCCLPPSRRLGARITWEQFGASQFDYIVVDEFHHAAARSYQAAHRVLFPEVPAWSDRHARNAWMVGTCLALMPGEPGLPS